MKVKNHVRASRQAGWLAHRSSEQKAASIFDRLRSLIALATLLGLCIAPGSAFADRIDGNAKGKRGKEEPLGHSSIILDAKGKRIADHEYKEWIKKYFWGAAIDVVMTQCNGGGFLNDIAEVRKRIKPLNRTTFASASAWDECSVTRATAPKSLAPTFDNPPLVENFTRAWNETARKGQSMRDSFRKASDGDFVIQGLTIHKDLYSPPSGFDGKVEHPQYESPDPQGGGPNGSRTLKHPQDPKKQYAILVAWPDKLGADDTIRADILRVYWNLRHNHGVPYENIVVLFGKEFRSIRHPKVKPRITLPISKALLSSVIGERMLKSSRS